MIDRNTDFYKTLQVHPDAAQEIIDAAYRCLSKKYHPDVNKNNIATEYMKDINIAYGVVGDSKKRRQYHYDWMKRNKTKQPPAAESPNVGSQEKTDFITRSAKEEAAAYSVLDDFFTETVNENWKKAYEKLTALDRKNVPMSDFVEWKKVVTQIYKLGGYKISFSKKYSNCEYAGVVYPVILKFSVALNEMKVTTSRFAEENTQKYVAFDDGIWRVCLGYKDLKSNIMKFKCLAKALPKVERDDCFIKAIEKIDFLTGLFNLSGFIEQADREQLRSKRYGNPISLAIIRIEPMEDRLNQEELNSGDACISFVSEVLCEKLRKTDLIGRCGESYLAVIFTETKLADAKKALNKLLKLCEPNEYLNYKIYSACVLFTDKDVDAQIKEALENAVLKEKILDKCADETEENQDKKLKLGKYKISDILGFNKKGRNHF